ncbi:TOBE domain-containing protein [Flammeovirga kamogawensis]|uniref:TOBE domain-containing protein n=1 Tax=Flammeovirga kamogawensis TaxID=373891 RepID=A0ABX8GYS6_9BACT|nr:TOBE domain-containing protein [Flammeovirga kamogawensis]MBB6460913.1 molybdopterin-binding protein [Flammeovirga kamogawensis]QWG08257.1 TOBE domain-containing protein [Flammeovirga kamogawensis]TRX70061.1 hypothetical protein EO216_18720 [Flammeovirga kamogawensis]
MNSFKGTITKITSEGIASLVYVNCSSITFKIVVLDNEETNQKLKIDATVSVLFKNTEVILSINSLNKSSIENSLEGKITSIDTGKIMSNLIITTSIGNIKALITSEQLNVLNLSLDTSVYLGIKSNEIMIAYD